MIRELHDRERPADSVIAVIHTIHLLIVLAPYKIWKDVAIGPSDVAEPGPVVVILARSSHICHPVHDARAPENLRIQVLHYIWFHIITPYEYLTGKYLLTKKNSLVFN